MVMPEAPTVLVSAVAVGAARGTATGCGRRAPLVNTGAALQADKLQVAGGSYKAFDGEAGLGVAGQGFIRNTLGIIEPAGKSAISR